MFVTGILCGECRDGMGVSALFNNCVSCHNAHGLLILALSRFTNSIVIIIINLLSLHAVVADAIAFIVIIVVDIALPGWIYPFIFYIQVWEIIASLRVQLVLLSVF